MSVQAISWALSVATGDPGAKVVLVTLANYADENGCCWPAQSTIAMQTEQSIDTVQRRLHDLEELGLLARRERPFQNGKKGGLYFYHLLMPGIGQILASETMPQIAVSYQTMPQTPQNHAANTPQTTPQLCGTNHHLITINSKEGENGFVEETGAYRAYPGSKEFLAWRDYAVKENRKFLVSHLDTRVLEGRPFHFDSQWPPGVVSQNA